MEWRGSRRVNLHLHILTIGYIGLLGVSLTNSQPTEREEWYGSVECPETLLIEWNDLLSRPPYVLRNYSVVSGSSGGLFKGKIKCDICYTISMSLLLL